MSVAPKQAIFVEPMALYFPPPLTRHIVNIVTVINSTDQPCVFKVHSFEPELYTVKPSAAVLAANSACRVQISLRKMKTEPDAAGITELNRKQKFKVRAKNVPAATYSKITSGTTPLSGGDVWKLCDQLPYSMDATLSCNFSGEVGPGATVTFDAPATGSHAAGGEMPSPPPTARSSTAANLRSPTPPPAATGSASNGNRAVSFVPESASASTSAPPPMKSSLKQPAAAEVVSASSATIRANTNTKSAISNSIADHNIRKAQLEQEIKEKQALLASLAVAEAQAQGSNKKKSSSGSGTLKKKSFLTKKVSISVVLILVIIFYVIGSVVRAKVGGEHVSRYVESIVPEEVRSAMANSKAAIDGAVANSLLSSFSATGVGIGAENSGATTEEGATATPTLNEEAAAGETKLDKSSEAGEVKPAKKEEASSESPSSPASASGGEKKKRRRKKVAKPEV